MADNGRNLKSIVSKEHCMARYSRLGNLRSKLADLELWLSNRLVPSRQMNEHLREIASVKKDIAIEERRIANKFAAIEMGEKINNPVEKYDRFENFDLMFEADDSYDSVDDDAAEEEDGGEEEIDDEDSFSDAARWARAVKMEESW